MAELFNFESGQLQDIPDDRVAEAVASGSFGFKKGARIPVVSPSGTPGTVPAEEAAKAFGSGFKFETADLVRQREGEEKFGGPVQTAAAGALGFARARTFGISDRVLTGMGVEPESLKALEEFNPGATMAGELGGVVTGFGAGATGAGVRAAAGLGQKAELALSTALNGFTAESRLAKAALTMAPKGLGAAVESVPYAIGELITEDALGDPDMTAEHVMSHVGMSALLGGAIGGAFSAPGALSKAIRESAAERAIAGDVAAGVTPGLAGDVVDATKATGGMIDDLYRAVTESEPAKNLGNKFLDVSSIITGVPREDLKKFLQPGAYSAAVRERAVAGPEVRENAVRKLAVLADETDRLSKDLQQEAIGGAKISRIEKQVKRGNEDEVGYAALSLLDSFDEISARMAETPHAYGAGANQLKFKKLLGDFRKITEKAVAKGDNAEVFTALDQFKRKMSPFAKFGKDMHFDINAADRAATEEFNSAYGAVRAHLENVGLYGQMAETQAAVNEAWERYLAKSGLFRGQFQQRVDQQAGRPVYATDRGKLESFVDNLTAVKNDQNYALMQSYRSAQKDLSEAIVNHYDLTGPEREKLKHAIENSKLFGEALDDIEKTVVVQNQLKAMERAGKQASQFVGAAAAGIGFAVGGIPGAALGGLLGAAANPAQLVRQLAVLRHMGIDAHAKIGSAIDNFFEKKSAKLAAQATREASRARATSIVNPVAVSLFGTNQRRDRQKAYQVDFERLSSVAANPTVLASRMAEVTPGLSATAPKTAAALTMQVSRAASYLLSIAPKAPEWVQPNTIMAKGWKPTEQQLASWERSKKAVEDPMSVIRGIGNGVITKEGIDALKACYPGYYAKCQEEVATKAAEQPDAIPHSKRVMLSIMFGVPVDPAMAPDMLASIQAGYAPQQPQQQGGGQAMRMPGVDKLSFSSESTTKAQRLEMGA